MSLEVVILFGIIIAISFEHKRLHTELKINRKRIADAVDLSSVVVREVFKTMESVTKRFDQDGKTMAIVLKALRNHKMITYARVKYKPSDDIPRV